MVRQILIMELPQSQGKLWDTQDFEHAISLGPMCSYHHAWTTRWRCDATEVVYVGPGDDSVLADLVHGHIVTHSDSDLIEVPHEYYSDVQSLLDRME